MRERKRQQESKREHTHNKETNKQKDKANNQKDKQQQRKGKMRKITERKRKEKKKSQQQRKERRRLLFAVRRWTLEKVRRKERYKATDIMPYSTWRQRGLWWNVLSLSAVQSLLRTKVTKAKCKLQCEIATAICCCNKCFWWEKHSLK